MERDSHNDSGNQRFKQSNDNNAKSGFLKNLFFKKPPDAERNKSQSDVADKPHAVNHFTGNQIQDIGPDQNA